MTTETTTDLEGAQAARTAYRRKLLFWVVLVNLAFDVFVLDFLSKFFMTRILTPVGHTGYDLSFRDFIMPSPEIAAGLRDPNFDPIEIIPGCLNMFLAHNTGGAFSVLSGNPVLLGLISLAIIFGIVWWARSFSSRHVLPFIALGMVIGGALGNIVDRFRFGYVIDFIDVYWGTHHWPTFNIADTFIDIGLGMIIVLAIFTKQLDGDKEMPKPPPPAK